ncbi:hypothetical protein KC367_g1072 [Hortaea werneckii]|nr:hypothetical protein KC357_g1155 [Hortaea werneckii]KAI7504543.1 hypothetical protein KC367_g1072 [Hortaea werneckii]
MTNRGVSKPVATKSVGSRSNGSTQKAVLEVVPKTAQRIFNASSKIKPSQDLSKVVQAGSSAAALRARREGCSPRDSAPKAQTTGVTSKPSKTAASGEKSTAEGLRQPLQDFDRNTRLPTPKDPRDRSNNDVRGKQSNDLPNSLRSADQRQTKNPVSYNNPGKARAYDTANSSLTSVPGALKRPQPKTDRLKSSTAPVRSSTYRIRESSPGERAESQPNRTSGKLTVFGNSNGATVKPRTGRGASPRSQRQRLPASKEAHANGLQPLIGNQLECSARDHAPNAVKAISVDSEARPQACSIAQKGQMSSRVHKTSSKPPNAYVEHQNEARPSESIEDFEKQVVAYSDHNRSSPVILKPGSNDVAIVPRQLRQGKRSGASQQSAILLADKCSSTPSDLGESPPQIKTPAANDRQGPISMVRAPRTPAPVQSSPPLENVRLSKTPGTGLTATSRKANIISFGDTGPRNQGYILMKTAPGSAWTNRSEKSSSPSWAARALEAGSGRVSIPGRRSQKPPTTSSVAASVRTSRTNCSSHSANVASTVDEALAGFFKETYAHAPSQCEASRSAHAPEMSKAGQEKQMSYLDDALANFDNHEDTIMSNNVAEQNPPARTESQLAMPPPPPKASKAGKSQPPALALNEPCKAREKEPARVKDDASLPSSKKRSAISQDEDRSITKRAKPTTKSFASNLSATNGSASFTEGCGTHDLTTTFGPNTKKASPKKPARNPSQGNVDCHGSPVPRGLEVPANATALEIYSQQADLSSDRLITQRTSNARSQRATRQSVDAEPLDQHVLPPSHQPKIMSSNTKIRPASPHEDSQAITGVTTRRVEPNSLVIRDVAAPPNTDPFTGSESARKDSSNTGPYSNFTQKLLKQAGEVSVGLGHQAGGMNRPLVAGQAPKKQSSKRQPSWSSDDSNYTDVSAETTDTMRDIGIWRNALQPYQVDLFDELVTVSHRLMRSLIDRETAAREVVEDYRRRGTRLVAQMEESHYLLYKEHMDELMQRKKKFKKELGKCCDQLQGVVATVQAASHERQQRLQRRSDEAAKIRKLVHDWL